MQKHSIASRLLAVSLALYLILAIIITVSHMVAEYHKARIDVIGALERIHETMTPAIALGIWNYSEEQVRTTIKGMVNLPDVGGVAVTDDGGKLSYFAGTLITAEGELLDTSKAKNIKEAMKINRSGDKGRGYQYKAPLTYTRGKTPIAIGVVTIYASKESVRQRVEFGFIVIIISAIIKTVALWVIFLWVSRFMLRRPLKKFTTALLNLDLDNEEFEPLSIGAKGSNELTTIQDSFNYMATKLRMAQFELKSVNTVLESTVKERTQALADSLFELENKNKQLEIAYAKLEDISTVDPLTGWRNRKFLSDHIEFDIELVSRTYGEWSKLKDWDNPPPYADLIFFLVDLDFFKLVNDQFGHNVGDKVIVQLCDLLASIFRRSSREREIPLVSEMLCCVFAWHIGCCLCVYGNWLKVIRLMLGSVHGLNFESG